MPCVDTTSEQLKIIEEYYLSESKSMFRYANRLLGNASLAEEAVQDTFAVALDKIDKFKNSPDPKSWLYATHKNIIRNMLRDQRLIFKRFVDVGDDIDFFERIPDNGNFKNMCEFTDDDDWSLLVEFYVYGLTLKEMSERDNITIGALKMRIRRARERIKAQINLS